MKRNSILYAVLFLGLINTSISQVSIKATIKNYPSQTLRIYQCYTDSLIFIDSVKTDARGRFSTSVYKENAIYKFVMPQNQWFYIIDDGKPCEINTIYQPNYFINWASDSLMVVNSDENKRFYEFHKQQRLVTIANYVIKEMMRLYPLQDPFHKVIEEEYSRRYKAMGELFKKTTSKYPNSLTAKLINAYYQPINPDWKQPDPWRDSIIAVHYFDYFNPADSFYLHTNILPEKLDIFLALKTNKRDNYGQPVNDEMLYAEAAQQFLEQTKINKASGGNGINPYYDAGAAFDFCLQYLLKKFNKEHKEMAFLYLYDQNLKPKEGNCETDNKQFDWARETAGKLLNIAIGSLAPDFTLSDSLQFSSIQSDYTLLLFWATWCPHCTQEVPEIKKAIDEFNSKSNKKILTVAVSLDSDREQWQKYVIVNNLFSFLNFSELKGWKGEISKKYNVYATPTMFLLDKDKKIIAKPISNTELIELLKVESDKSGK